MLNFQKLLPILVLCLLCSFVLLACGNEEVGAGRLTPAVPTTMPIQGTTPALSLTPTVAALDVVHKPFYQPIPTGQINQAKQEWRVMLNQAEQKWQDAHINSYQIEVSHVDTTWNPIPLYRLTVKNGQIISKSNRVTARLCCATDTPYPTLDTFDASSYTVPGLFNLLRSRLETSWTENTAFRAEFDSVYGYPRLIVADFIHYTDLQQIWSVTSFQPLP